MFATAWFPPFVVEVETVPVDQRLHPPIDDQRHERILFVRSPSADAQRIVYQGANERDDLVVMARPREVVVFEYHAPDAAKVIGASASAKVELLLLERRSVGQEIGPSQPLGSHDNALDTGELVEDRFQRGLSCWLPVLHGIDRLEQQPARLSLAGCQRIYASFGRCIDYRCVVLSPAAAVWTPVSLFPPLSANGGALNLKASFAMSGYGETVNRAKRR